MGHSISFEVTGKTALADEKLQALTDKLDKLTAFTHDLVVELADNGAIAKLDAFKARLDEIGLKDTVAKVSVDVDSSQVDKLAKDLEGKVGGGGLFGKLAGLFGGSGNSGGSGSSSSGDGSGWATSTVNAFKGIWSGAPPYLIGGGIGLAGSLIPALIPSLLGLGIGGIGAMGAYSLDPTAFTSVLGDLKKTFDAALTQAGPGDRGVNGKITDNQPSFLTGIKGILSEVDGFVREIGPSLGDMFRSSLPFIQGFASVMAQLTQAALPIFTQLMKQMTPYLPIMEKGFVALGQALLYFLKDLGPGMKDAAIIFEGAAEVVKGVAIALAYACDALAIGLVKSIEWLKEFGVDVKNWVYNTAGWFKTWGHAVYETFVQTWDFVYSYTVGSFVKFGDYIAGSFQKFGSLMYQFGRDIILGVIHGFDDTVGWLIDRVKSVANWISDAFSAVLHMHSPSKVFYEHGQNIIRGLVMGLDDGLPMVHAAMSRLGNAVQPGAARGGGYGGVAAAGAGGAQVIRLEFVGNDAFTTFLKKNIRLHGGNPNVVGR